MRSSLPRLSAVADVVARRNPEAFAVAAAPAATESAAAPAAVVEKEEEKEESDDVRSPSPRRLQHPR